MEKDHSTQVKTYLAACAAYQQEHDQEPIMIDHSSFKREPDWEEFIQWIAWRKSQKLDCVRIIAMQKTGGRYQVPTRWPWEFDAKFKRTIGIAKLESSSFNKMSETERKQTVARVIKSVADGFRMPKAGSNPRINSEYNPDLPGGYLGDLSPQQQLDLGLISGKVQETSRQVMERLAEMKKIRMKNHGVSFTKADYRQSPVPIASLNAIRGIEDAKTD